MESTCNLIIKEHKGAQKRKRSRLDQHGDRQINFGNVPPANRSENVIYIVMPVIVAQL